MPETDEVETRSPGCSVGNHSGSQMVHALKTAFEGWYNDLVPHPIGRRPSRTGCFGRYVGPAPVLQKNEEHVVAFLLPESSGRGIQRLFW